MNLSSECKSDFSDWMPVLSSNLIEEISPKSETLSTNIKSL